MNISVLVSRVAKYGKVVHVYVAPTGDVSFRPIKGYVMAGCYDSKLPSSSVSRLCQDIKQAQEDAGDCDDE